jgi:hypothetical protein
VEYGPVVRVEGQQVSADMATIAATEPDCGAPIEAPTMRVP